MLKNNAIQRISVLSTKMLFPQKDENALTTLLYSADEISYSKKVNMLKVIYVYIKFKL